MSFKCHLYLCIHFHGSVDLFSRKFQRLHRANIPTYNYHGSTDSTLALGFPTQPDWPAARDWNAVAEAAVASLLCETIKNHPLFLVHPAERIGRVISNHCRVFTWKQRGLALRIEGSVKFCRRSSTACLRQGHAAVPGQAGERFSIPRVTRVALTAETRGMLRSLRLSGILETFLTAFAAWIPHAGFLCTISFTMCKGETQGADAYYNVSGTVEHHYAATVAFICTALIRFAQTVLCSWDPKLQGTDLNDLKTCNTRV